MPFQGMPRAAVEFEDPLGGVVEEVAVVGDGHHGAGEALQELLQPVHRFGVQVVGRLVEQQHVGLGQQQRHSATRRFSPPDSLPITASQGGRRSASAAISSWCSVFARRRWR
ncbi:MAG: hypothetical protein LKM39_10580 [Chiayiivirga sp.]|nr:hypothetical protein [Chiayiivirga sp.]